MPRTDVVSARGGRVGRRKIRDADVQASFCEYYRLDSAVPSAVIGL